MSEKRRYQSEVTIELTRLQKFRQFCYNTETKELFGKSPLTWLYLFVFHVGSWCFFAGVFLLILKVDLLTRDHVKPEFNFNDFQPYLQEPGLQVIPRGNSVIRPIIIDVDDVENNVNELRQFLKEYPSRMIATTNCNESTLQDYCTMRIAESTLGPCSPLVDPSFGYSKQEPCVLLKVNKIWGWKPKLHEQRPADLPADINFSTKSMPISCHVWHKLYDHPYSGRVEEVKIYPSSGVLEKCFPYCNTQFNYVQPFVMAHFKGLDKTKSIAVVCVAHAQNIKDSRDDKYKIEDNIGSISFVLLAKQK